jgi:hypothetical protein
VFIVFTGSHNVVIINLHGSVAPVLFVGWWNKGTALELGAAKENFGLAAKQLPCLTEFSGNAAFVPKSQSVRPGVLVPWKKAGHPDNSLFPAKSDVFPGA